MARHTLPLEIVLPNVAGADDACVRRLTDLARAYDGVSLAHATDDGRRCVHFDPGRVSMAEVRRLLMAAGARLSAEYGHVSLAFGGAVNDAGPSPSTSVCCC